MGRTERTIEVKCGTPEECFIREAEVIREYFGLAMHYTENISGRDETTYTFTHICSGRAVALQVPRKMKESVWYVLTNSGIDYSFEWNEGDGAKAIPLALCRVGSLVQMAVKYYWEHADDE